MEVLRGRRVMGWVVLGEDGDGCVCAWFVGAGFDGSGGPEEGEQGKGGKTWLLWRIVGNAIGGGKVLVV